MAKVRDSLVEELTETSQQYATAVHAVEELRGRLYALIREARSGGMSLREIAKASGLTFARVHQITSPHGSVRPSRHPRP